MEWDILRHFPHRKKTPKSIIISSLRKLNIPAHISGEQDMCKK